MKNKTICLILLLITTINKAMGDNDTNISLLSTGTNDNLTMDYSGSYINNFNTFENDITTQNQIFFDLLTAMYNQQLPKTNNQVFDDNTILLNNISKKRPLEVDTIQDQQNTKKQKIDTSKAKENSSHQKQNYNLPAETSFQCIKCNKAFKRNIDLKDHMTVHSEKRPFQCNYENCNKAFKHKRSLQNHITNHSNKKLYQSDNERPYGCNYKGCNRRFKHKYNLQVHTALHSDETPYTCDYCDKTFKLKNTLYKHTQAKHIKNKEHHCTYTNCDKIYQTQSGLNKHIQTMHNNIHFNCFECNKIFTKKENLKIHIKKYH